MSQPSSLRILVCGDGGRGDDGAALIAMGRLLPTLPRPILDQIEVHRHEVLDVGGLRDLQATSSCLIVDAATGVEAGVVVTVSLGALAIDPASAIPRSLHGRSLGDGLRALELARHELPRGSFVGLGGRSFGFGVPLSIPVRNALPVFVAAIGLEINRLLRLDAVPAR
jgi:hydrogenase maturation protease